MSTYSPISPSNPLSHRLNDLRLVTSTFALSACLNKQHRTLVSQCPMPDGVNFFIGDKKGLPPNSFYSPIEMTLEGLHKVFPGTPFEALFDNPTPIAIKDRQSLLRSLPAKVTGSGVVIVDFDDTFAPLLNINKLLKIPTLQVVKTAITLVPGSVDWDLDKVVEVCAAHGLREELVNYDSIETRLASFRWPETVELANTLADTFGPAALPGIPMAPRQPGILKYSMRDIHRDFNIKESFTHWAARWVKNQPHIVQEEASDTGRPRKEFYVDEILAARVIERYTNSRLLDEY